MTHLRRLLPYLRRHRRPLVLGLVCLLLTTLLSVASPWVLRYAVDDLTHALTRGKPSNVLQAVARRKKRHQRG